MLREQPALGTACLHEPPGINVCHEDETPVRTTHAGTVFTTSRLALGLPLGCDSVVSLMGRFRRTDVRISKNGLRKTWDECVSTDGLSLRDQVWRR